MAASPIPAMLAVLIFIACFLIRTDCASVSEMGSESMLEKYARNLFEEMVNTDIMKTACEDLTDTLRCGVESQPGITIVVKKSAAVYINNKEGMDKVLENLNSCLNLDKFK